MASPATSSSSRVSELSAALRQCRGAFASVAVVSGMINILYLTGSFFMLEVYDRVIPSRSIPTLVGLAVLATVLYAFQGVLEVIRGRVLLRIGSALDVGLSGRVYDVVTRLPLRTRNADGMQALRDLDQVRSFTSGLGPATLFDLPWLPLYLGICYLFHPLIGLATTIGGAVLVTITLLTEAMTQKPLMAAAKFGSQRNGLAEASRRNAEVLRVLGMGGRLGAVWGEANARYMEAQRHASDVAGGFGGSSKVLRMLLQSGVLAIGAYLVIRQEATAGIIIASSILTSRALAPLELAIAHWKGFVGARQSWHRLNDLLRQLPPEDEMMALPAPKAMLSVESVSVAPPGGRTIVVHDVSLQLRAGSGVGVIGPSGSGKSTLVRGIVGAWQPVRGKVRLDGAALEQWSSERLGRHLGYLPQDVELFAGTVAQNISRFEVEPDPDKIVAAATAAGVHDLILRLSEGYETQIGESGETLSAGQRQRVGLARALYGDPFLVVLDEPNSNLDAEGEQALTHAMMGVRARGGIVIVVAHRPTALSAVDFVLVMNEGKAQAFGPKDEVLSKVLRRPAVAAAGLASQTVVPLKASGAAS